jgi:hypothetical protein
MEKQFYKGRPLGALVFNETKLNRVLFDEDTREGIRRTPAAPYLGLMVSMEQQTDLLVRAGE